MKTTGLTTAEQLFLKKFFDEVDFAVSHEINAAKVAYEEFLSSVLGRLLDDESPFQSLLSYSVRQLNTDLARCGSGNRVSIEFETNEHDKSFSGSTSHVDLGIILRREDPLFGETFEKAILVECKRLYRAGRKKTYTMRSRYDGFDSKQCRSLESIAEQHDWSIFYFLYNPTLDSFDNNDREVVQAIENRLCSSLPFVGRRFHPKEIYYLIEECGGFPLRTPLGGPTSSADGEEVRKSMEAYVSRRPGLRVLSLYDVLEIVKSEKLSLRACYKHVLKGETGWRERRVPFSSLSEFMVDFFLSCHRGTTNEVIRRIAACESPERKSDDSDDPAAGVLAKHTLRIKLSSELHEAEGELGGQ